MSLEPVVTQQWNIRVQDEVGMMTLYKKEPEEFGVGSMRQREAVPQDCLKSPPIWFFLFRPGLSCTIAVDYPL